MITKTCGELNQQEWIKHNYYSLMQTSSVCDFLADLLFLVYHINPSPSQDTVCDYFKQGLKNHVLNELSCMTDKPLNLYKFMKLCDEIDRHWVERCRHYDETISYNWMDSSNQFPTMDWFWSMSSAQSHSWLLMCSADADKSIKSTPQWQNWCKVNKTCFECSSTSHNYYDCTSWFCNSSWNSSWSSYHFSYSHLNYWKSFWHSHNYSISRSWGSSHSMSSRPGVSDCISYPVWGSSPHPKCTMICDLWKNNHKYKLRKD